MLVRAFDKAATASRARALAADAAASASFASNVSMTIGGRSMPVPPEVELDETTLPSSSSIPPPPPPLPCLHYFC
jgi:hypothetical protein